MNSAFELRDVVYRDILNIADLVIPSGSISCITGESGSGKTTLLRLLNNLIPLDRGSIKYFGRDILSLDPVALRRKALMVPQAPFIFPGTAGQNLAQACRYAQKEVPAEDKMEQLLVSLGLTGKLERNAASFSGGEKQRLALARAMLLNPEALLLDEPTAALDETSQEKVMNVLEQLVRTQGMTVIMITHAIGLTERFGSQVISLHRGKIFSLRNRGGGIE